MLGKTAPITEEQEKSLGDRGVDTSCIMTTPSKYILIINGPVCFVNHDCAPNCSFVRLPNKDICFEAKKKIKPGEELTIDYGAGYFGQNQKYCQCPTCEAEKQGAYRKRKQGERKDRDLWTQEEEKKIVKVSVCLFYESLY